MVFSKKEPPYHSKMISFDDISNQAIHVRLAIFAKH